MESYAYEVCWHYSTSPLRKFYQSLDDHVDSQIRPLNNAQVQNQFPLLDYYSIAKIDV